MGIIARVLAWLLSAAFLLVAALYVASEGAGEVVTLHTTDSSGEWHDTSLWIAEADGVAWLRAGVHDASWLLRIGKGADVELTRGGLRYTCRASPDPSPERREQIHRLLRERYGWGDRMIAWVRDGSRSVPVRLDGCESAEARALEE